MKKTQILYLIYRRLRVGLGTFGLILMYGAYTGNFSILLLLVGIGFYSIELFGAFYNDYNDYELDIKNKRKDKWLVNKLLRRKQIKNLSFLFLLIGIISLFFTSTLVFLLGLFYAFLAFGYSYSKIPLGRNLISYLLIASVFVFLIPSMSLLFSRNISMLDILFIIFTFFQSAYLFAQKDSTDTKDDTNLFIEMGWKSASLTLIIIGILASVSLFLLSLSYVVLLFIWCLNLFSKTYLLNEIYRKTIDRKTRVRILLIEFLTPYFYVLNFVI